MVKINIDSIVYVHREGEKETETERESKTENIAKL